MNKPTIYHRAQVKYWDLWMGLQLLFTAVVTPYQVAFLSTHLDGGFTAATGRLPCCASWTMGPSGRTQKNCNDSS